MPEALIATSTPASKVNLLGMTRAQLEAFFGEIGEKKFRAQQVMKWMHHQGVRDFQAMTNLGKGLRDRLDSCAEITPPQIESQQDSADGTRKWAIKVDGGALVEAVLIPEGDRATLCVSSQVGCSLDCKFCSTGKQGFQRDLTAAEIIGQVWLAINSYDGWQAGKGRVVTNVVMMGMGEPLLNFDKLLVPWTSCVMTLPMVCQNAKLPYRRRVLFLPWIDSRSSPMSALPCHCTHQMTRFETKLYPSIDGILLQNYSIRHVLI